MKTVSEVSKMTGLSIRTLHYYDKVGILPPTVITEAGYRLYDDKALELLQHIMLYRELKFSLKEIGEIIHCSDFERNRALEQQIRLLTLKKEHIENMITFARGIQGVGVKNMDFSAFDAKKMDDYAAQAKATWGKTEAYKEFEQKTKNLTKVQQDQAGEKMMELFAEFGQMKQLSPADEKVQEQVRKLQNYITEHYYTCTDTILKGLGKMYSGGGSMTENIDKAGGNGTGMFVDQAIQVYCNK